MAGDKPTETSDLNFAAYLRVMGVPMMGARRVDIKRVVFEFSPDQGDVIQAASREFFNRRTKVDALTYAQEQKALKTLCFNT
jgi:hypothetical protein